MFSYLKKAKPYMIFRAVILTIMLATSVYVIYQVIITPFSKNGGNPPWLMLWQCFVGVVAMFLPDFLEKKFNLIIPPALIISYVILLFCSIYLGEIHAFYYNFKIFGYRVWDVMLHLSYSAMLVALGFSVLAMINKWKNVRLSFTPMCIILFAFCFAITIDAAWEIMEFTIDTIGGYNMQKFRDANGAEFIGRAALMDTMKDIIIDFIGASVMCIISYISIKKNPKFLDNMLIECRKAEKNDGNPDSNETVRTDSTAETKNPGNLTIAAKEDDSTGNK